MRIRVVATLDPDPERELERWRGRLSDADAVEAEQIRTRMQRYEGGQELIVRLSVTLEAAGDGGLGSVAGPQIDGVWFALDERAGNEEHARELVIESVRGLEQDGLPGGSAVPISVQVDDALAAALRS